MKKVIEDLSNFNKKTLQDVKESLSNDIEASKDQIKAKINDVEQGLSNKI